MSELVDRFTEDNKLLGNRLEIIKNKRNIFIFIFLSKVFIIQKHWLIIEYNK